MLVRVGRNGQYGDYLIDPLSHEEGEAQYDSGLAHTHTYTHTHTHTWTYFSYCLASGLILHRPVRFVTAGPRPV